MYKETTRYQAGIEGKKLPVNCNLEYFRNFLPKETCDSLYQNLAIDHKISTYNKKYAAGKLYELDYGKIMFIDQVLYDNDAFPEALWGKSFPWSKKLYSIKEAVENLIGRTFHVCVCVYYPDGNSGVGYHCDYPAYGDTSVIASLSIGEEREFLLREKSSLTETRILLEEGSLLIMGDHCQERYEHSLPTDPIYKNGRINLTFRQYGFEDNPNL